MTLPSETEDTEPAVYPSSNWTAVRIGDRVAHALSGRTTNGNVLTLCGLTIDHTNPRYGEIEPERVPIGRHCLRCWS